MRRQRSGYPIGLVAALLFGASAPFSKLLLDSVAPQLLAGLLYRGAFVGVALFIATRPLRHEAALRRADLSRLAVVAAGGIVAPVLLVRAYLVGFGSIVGVLATAGGVVMVATATIGFCPLYVPFDLHTNARHGAAI